MVLRPQSIKPEYIVFAGSLIIRILRTSPGVPKTQPIAPAKPPAVSFLKNGTS